MGFLNSDSLPYLVEKLSDGDNIKVTGNSKGNRVSSIVSKISEKASDITKATFQQVTNTTTLFKTGTGDVDVSESMEEGFGNIGIKGNSLVNLALNKDNRIELTDERSTISEYIAGYTNYELSMKPNTTYTIIFNFKITKLITDDKIYIQLKIADTSDKQLYTRLLPDTTTNINTKIIKSFTTPNNVSPNSMYIGIASSGNTTLSCLMDNILILEGDWIDKEIPSYFEGIKSVGEPTLDGKYKVEFISTNTSKNDSHKTHFFLNEPLRKKNDSVYDEILDDGTLIRRCGQFVLEDVDAKQTISSNQVSDITQAIYELETPIVEKIAPLTLRLYKEGYISLNTIPTETTHMILLNKSAQIENSIKEIKSLKKRVGDLEGICGDIILDTSRKLSLLEFDYNLTRVSMEEKE